MEGIVIYALRNTAVTTISPPFISANISPSILYISCLQIYIPSPLPLLLPALEPRQKLSNICGISVSGSVFPLFRTATSIQPSSSRIFMPMLFPSPYFMAFSIIFCKTSSDLEISPYNRQSIYLPIVKLVLPSFNFSL